MVKVLKGPTNLQLTLDSSEIVPGDPGAGTPAMVTKGRAAGTWWCAVNTGELVAGEREYLLSDREHRWLLEQSSVVEDFMATYTP